MTPKQIAIASGALLICLSFASTSHAATCAEEIVTVRKTLDAPESAAAKDLAMPHFLVAEIYARAGNETECIVALHRAASALGRDDRMSLQALALKPEESRELADGWSVNTAWMNRNVYDRAGSEIGKVSDIVVSRHFSHPMFVIVDFGGFLGLGGHEVAVPMTAFTNVNGKLHLDAATRNSLSGLPEYVPPVS